MRRLITALLAGAMLVLLLAGCGGAPSGVADDGRLKIVTTTFPLYDWTREILGDAASGAELTMLLSSGVDLHSFQPTAADILKISTCDVFIYVGGESDKWVADALGEAVNGDMIVVSMLDALGGLAKEEELVEGMEAGEEDEDGDEGPEYDEHVWLSLKNAEALCSAIAEALGRADPENADAYAKNAAAYDEKLAALDAEYETMVGAAAVKTFLFGDRFPFRYLADDYGLTYYAAFSGCSAESEASFETIMFLADKVDELGLSSVMTIEGTDHRIAETIVANTAAKDQTIRTLDSMQSVTASDVQAGATYLALMEKNLAVLRDALN